MSVDLEAAIYTLAGREKEKIILPRRIFGLSLNRDLLEQARLAVLANQRRPVAHTKDRSEVRGGGRKPWRQKGTGRARHGSIRSPIWKGGGVTHGPRKEKKYSQKLNAKMSHRALAVALSERFRQGRVKLLEDFNFTGRKTKDFIELVKKIESDQGNLLLVLSAPERSLSQSSRNVPGIKVIPAAGLNVLDVLRFGQLVITKGAVEYLAQKYVSD